MNRVVWHPNEFIEGKRGFLRIGEKSAKELGRTEIVKVKGFCDETRNAAINRSGKVMKKTNKFSRKWISFLAAVTLVAAVVVPDSGRILLYADTNAEICEQKILEEPATEDILTANMPETEDLTEQEIKNGKPEEEETEDDPRENDVLPEEETEKTSDGDDASEAVESTETGSLEEAAPVGEVKETGENEENPGTEEHEPRVEEEPEESPERGDFIREETAIAELDNQIEEDEEEPERTFDEELQKAAEESDRSEELNVENTEEEPAFVFDSEIRSEEVLAGAKNGELPISGGICHIQLLKNEDTLTGAEDGYVVTAPADQKQLQKFFAEKIGKNWRFVNTITGKALVVTKKDGNGGRFVAMEEPTGGKRELWRLVECGRGYSLKSVADGRVLTSALDGAGHYTILKEEKGVTRQIWTFTSCQESIKEADIKVSSSVGSGAKNLLPAVRICIGGRLLAKDVDYTMTGGSAVGASKVIIRGIGNYSGKVTRAYEIVEAAGEIRDGEYYLLVPRADRAVVMAAQDGGMVNGTDIVAEQKTGDENQIFKVEKSEDGYLFKNAKSEKAFSPAKSGKGADISLTSSENTGSKIKAVPCANGAFVFRAESGRYLKYLGGRMVTANKRISEGAYFYLVPAIGPSMTFSGTYFLRTMTRIRLVAGISASSKASGAAAILSNYADASAQRFDFLYSGSGYYRIISEKSRKALTANADGTVVQQPWTAGDAQRWKPVSSAGGYLLTNANGKVLTVIGGFVKRGRALGVSDANGSTNQVFLLLERGSGEAKKNLVKKPLTIYKGTDYSAVYNYDDYMDRYTKLADIYGTDCAGALRYFVEKGMSEGQHGSDAFDVWCYRRSNPGVRRQLLADIPAYYLHYIKTGKAQGLKASGYYQTTQAVSQKDLAWKCYNEWGDFSNRPYSQQMCELLSAAAEMQYQAYGFPKSVIIAMSIKECGFLTFNGGLPPTSNNVLTMNVDMWNGRWKSGWLGGYASVKVPQYDSASGQLVYGYENVRCYEDIEACMEDFANFKVSLLGPVPAGMSINAVVDKYLEGYATSPDYKSSILATIKLHQLTRFDH